MTSGMEDTKNTLTEKDIRQLLIELIDNGLCEDVQAGGSFSCDIAGDFEKDKHCRIEDVVWSSGCLIVKTTKNFKQKDFVFEVSFNLRNRGV